MSEVAGSAPSSAPTSSGGAPSTPTAAPKAQAPVSEGASTAGVPGKPNPQSKNVAPPSGKRTVADQVAPKAEAPAQSQEEKAEARREAERRKYQFKVDGKEWEEELSEDDVKIRLQKAIAADKRMQEAAEYRKKFNEALEYGKQNPADAFKKLFGVDLDEYAEKRLAEKYQEAIMPEHERAVLEERKAREAAEAQLKQIREAQEHAAKTQFEQQVWQQTQQEFVGALEQLGYEPAFAKSHLLPLMADVAEANLDYGIELDPPTLAAQVQKRLQTIHQKQLHGLKGDSLLNYLGNDVVKEIIRAKLEKVKLTPPEPAPQPVAEPPPPEKKKSMTSAEFRRKFIFGLE